MNQIDKALSGISKKDVDELFQYRENVLDYRGRTFTIEDLKQYANLNEIPMVFEEFPEKIRFDIYCFSRHAQEIENFLERVVAVGVRFVVIPVDGIEYSQKALEEYKHENRN